ncbi:MAG: DHH family phosphoesterase [Collinsella sp.]|nr:DHH family phosphoesterase [Collinsella sp.]
MERHNQERQGILEQMKACDDFLIIGHVSPDGDTVGSSLALCLGLSQLGKKVAFGLHGVFPEKLAFMPAAFPITASEQVEQRAYGAVIAVDCGDLSRLGDLGAVFSQNENTIVIDHHPTNTGFGKRNLVLPYGATGQIILELLEALGCGNAVALTICSKATMIVLRMMRAPGAWRLSLSKLGIDRGICKSMISCGLPLGFQSAAYSISNVLIQVSVNSFGADITTAWGLSGRLDGIIWMVTEALGVSITTFSAQNFGARNYERMRKGYHTSLVLSFMLIGGLSAVLLVFSGPLSRLFVDDASISAYTTTILHFIAPFYAIFSIIENASGSIRGAGVSLQPMMLTIFGTVVLRVIWVFAIMPFDPSLEHLLLVYPVTWLITATMFTIYHHSGNWLGRATA